MKTTKPDSAPTALVTGAIVLACSRYAWQAPRAEVPQIERTPVRIAQASDDAKTTASAFAPVEAWGMLTDMAESQWLITSPEGKILSSETFELVWNSSDPAYRSMLALKSVTTGAVILRIEVDKSTNT